MAEFNSNSTTDYLADCPESQRLRACIRRLEAELAERQTEARALPSSVMRAYQALIDKHYASLERLISPS